MSGFDVDAAIAGLPDAEETMDFGYLEAARARISSARRPDPSPEPAATGDSNTGLEAEPVADEALAQLQPAQDPDLDRDTVSQGHESDLDLGDFDHERPQETPGPPQGLLDAADQAAPSRATSAAGPSVARPAAAAPVGRRDGGGASAPSAPPSQPADVASSATAAGATEEGQAGTLAVLLGEASRPPYEAEGTTDRLDVAADTDADRSVATTGPRGGSETARDTTGPLPATGFALSGRAKKDQPRMVALPPEILSALQADLRRAAQEQLGLSEREADEFVNGQNGPGQTALVLAFLAAQLDLALDADERTMLMVRLFATRNPLLGAVLSRLTALEATERETRETLRGVKQSIKDVTAQTDMAELSVTWLVAERAGLGVAQNLGGATDADLVGNLTNKSAQRMRRLVRDAAKEQRRRDQSTEGRPRR